MLLCMLQHIHYAHAPAFAAVHAAAHQRCKLFLQLLSDMIVQQHAHPAHISHTPDAKQ